MRHPEWLIAAYESGDKEGFANGMRKTNDMLDALRDVEKSLPDHLASTFEENFRLMDDELKGDLTHLTKSSFNSDIFAEKAPVYFRKFLKDRRAFLKDRRAMSVLGALGVSRSDAEKIVQGDYATIERVRSAFYDFLLHEDRGRITTSFDETYEALNTSGDRADVAYALAKDLDEIRDVYIKTGNEGLIRRTVRVLSEASNLNSREVESIVRKYVETGDAELCTSGGWYVGK